MILTVVYQLIIAFVLISIIWGIFTETKGTKQIVCAMVLIPLVMRMFMIK